MKSFSVAAIFFFILLAGGAPPASCASAFSAEATPRRITPGSAFLLKVTGTSTPPDASVNDTPLPFGECGSECFLAIGSLGIDTPPGEYEIVLSAGGKKVLVPLTVERASFPTISITLPERRVVLNADDLKRAKEEENRLEMIWRTISDRRWNGSFLLPLEHETSTFFGTVRIINKETRSVHRGIDIRGSEGDPIRASNAGKVVLAEELFFGGNTVILDHGMGIYTIYMHLSKFAVAAGDVVSKEDVIGYVGSTGRASGPHLHFSVKINTVSTDPLSLVNLRP